MSTPFFKKVLRQGGAHSGWPGHTTLRRSSATAPTMPLLRGKASAQAWTAACHTSIFRGSDCPRKDYESLGRFQESLTAEQRGIPREGRSSIGEAAASGSRPCRPGGSKCAVGSADIRFPGNPGKPENSGSSMYASRIRRRNRRQPVAVGPADPAGARACRLSLPGGTPGAWRASNRQKKIFRKTHRNVCNFQ